jgi:hypothetical protein
MPTVPFNSLPDDARLWVFAASDPVTGERADRLLAAVDVWLSEWKAHGEPLTCARDWRDDRFLVIGVDQSTAGASGCSIDALFRVLQDLQGTLATSLLGGGRVFYRDREGKITTTDRGTFVSRAASSDLDTDTLVFDTSVTTVAAYRSSFMRRAGESWHRDLLPAAART